MDPTSVLAYFGEDPPRAYQLTQWLPVLELLDSTEPVTVVLRREDSAELVRPRTRLPMVVAPGLGDLRAAYARLDPKVVLYCNNSPTNFDSLLEPRALHVHVSHGESDKQSSASNNAKSYDRVFVAGAAAVHRYATGLLEFDTARLVRVGRPQLDLPHERVLPASPRRTVLYAPTWRGDADYNNYSSLGALGAEIVRQLRTVPDVRVVYKPHPQIVASRDPADVRGHAEVVRQLAGDDVVLEDADILAVLPDCDALVTDVSSVGLDWLYLCTDRPLFVADRHADPERLRAEAPVSRCADVVDAGTVGRFGELVADRLRHDGLYEARKDMRRHYFDDVEVGESTTRFVDAVSRLAALRDVLLAAQIAQHPLAGQQGR